MKKTLCPWLMLLLLLTINSCQPSEQNDVTPTNQVPETVLKKLHDLGFNVTDRPPRPFDKGYLVDGDIYVTDADLGPLNISKLPTTEQYCVFNRVTGTPRNITVHLATTFPSTYATSLNIALARFNAQALTLTFTRVTVSAGADIHIVPYNNSGGPLAFSGFPSASGNPYGTISLNSMLSSITYGFSNDAIATLITHEIGHCIGLLHSDYLGGGPCNAQPPPLPSGQHIPGTPTLDQLSFMLSCVAGNNRPFTTGDMNALNYMY